MNYKRFVPMALVVVTAAVAVTYLATRPEKREPQRLETAVRALAEDLRTQLVRHRSGLLASLAPATEQATDAAAHAPVDPAAIVVAPFVDANSGEVVKVSQQVEQLVSGWLVDSGAFSASALTPANLVDAEYVMFGVLLLDDFGEKGSGDKRYHIIVSAVEHGTRRIAAQADAWVAEADLDYTPAPLYRDSPVFPRDQRLASMVAIARSEPGTPADREYYDSLETNALMAEAESWFDASDFAHARTLFKQATERKDGQVMKSYLGLYRSSVKLDDMAGAEGAFRKLVDVGADNGLNTKFLFAVNSTQFIADASLRQQYDMWTRQIGDYFETDGRCIQVVGHCSRTGAGGYNDKLSLARAQSIKDRIASGAPSVGKRSRALGKGFNENLVGSGTDDKRDALDRRVEVVVVDCPAL